MDTTLNVYSWRGYLLAFLNISLQWCAERRCRWLESIKVGFLTSKGDKTWFGKYISFFEIIERSLDNADLLSCSLQDVRANVHRILLSDSDRCQDRVLPGSLLVSVHVSGEDVSGFGSRIVRMAAMLEAGKTSRDRPTVNEYALRQSARFLSAFELAERKEPRGIGGHPESSD